MKWFVLPMERDKLNTYISNQILIMKLFCRSIIVFFFVFPIIKMSSQQSESDPVTSEPAIENLVSIKDNSGYKHLVTRLKNVMKREGTSQTNHFFVAKYPGDGKSSITYMVWREGRRMWILYINGGDDYDSWQGVEFPRGGSHIDFDTDVVATREEVGSSTYLSDQPWVNERVFDAVVNGDLIIIERE